MTLKTLLPVERLSGRPHRIPTRRISGKLWPTGEFSYGYYSERQDSRLDERELTYWCGDEPAPLDLTKLPNSHTGPSCLLSAGPQGRKDAPKRPKKYGRKGITGYGKKMLKSAGHLLQRQPQRYRLTFATVTLPEMPSEVRRSVAAGWGALLNRLVQWLCRRLERQELPKAILSATEVQPKRLERTGQAYLHLHLIWPNHREEKRGWAIAPNDIRAWMESYLKSHHNTGDIGYINIDTRAVKHSAAGYLAKYMSKGRDDVDAAIEDLGEESIPGQWWSMTKLLKEWVWLAMEVGEEIGEKLEQWVNWAFDYDNFELFRYIYHVEADIGGRPVTVGWRGCLSPSGVALWDG